ncbi:phage tail tape measure protein [Anaerostipes hadrus]|uniref:Phage tail tape measure protein n=3 Tax=Anaerostipes hadrus TaxID=649756 RepID=A0ABX2I0C8_ANAHA|nr:phage tail tape measure protein [Anaerostipes hadrus]MCQ4782780.1 phage tail tape measure protein [Anaerostipes hadrus]NSG99851.1 phage tail tape measure protein [Anaerostipes hadrus]NSH09179.1 phage tail tape measure protein [Anaerostipes hadrus]NSJ80328.1 phage tail tape measure protein [Anaerostipes hadrus]
MADGTVTIETKLDNSGVEKGLNDLKKEVESSSKSTAQEIDKASDQAQKSVEEVAKSAEKTGKQVEKSAKDSASKAGQAAKQGADTAAKGTESASTKMQQSHKKVKETAKESADGAKKSWEESNQSTVASTESATSKMAGLMKKSAAVIGVASVAAAKKTIDVGKSFEAGMSEVQAISGASGKDLEKLSAKAKQMGATTKFSATESATALKYMAMAGWKTNQMVSGLSGVMNLAAASGEDLGTVSDIVTDSMTAFGLKAKDSGHFADVLAKASSSSNTNVAMMGETFKYVAPLAGSMKYSIEDTATAIGLMANAGIKGSQAGTSLRSIITRLVKPPKDAATALNALGISTTKADGSMKPLRETMAELREKFSGLTESQKASYASSIAGQEAMSGLLAIVNASDSDFNKLQKAIDNSSGAAKKQADVMNNNLQGALYDLGSVAESVGIGIYEDIKTPLTKAVGVGTAQLRVLSNKLKKGGIKEIVPKEAINTVENLGKVAMVAGKGGVKALATSTKLLGDNMGVVIPLATSFMGAWAGVKVFNTASKGVTALTTAFSALKTMEQANAITLVAQQGGLTALQTVVGIFTGKISLATAATGAFNAACTALGGPVGLGVVAVGALAAGVAAYALTQKKAVTEADRYYSSCTKLKKKQEEMAASIKSLHKENQKNVDSTRANGVQADQLYQRLTKLMNVEHKSAGTKAQIASVVKQLNELLPGLNLEYDKEADKLNKSTSAIKKNIAALKEQAMAKAYQNGMESAAKKSAEAEIAYKEALEDRAKAQEKVKATQKEFDKRKSEVGLGSGDKKLEKLGEDLITYKKALQEADGAVKKSSKNLNDAHKELDTYTDKYTAQANYTAYLKSLDDLSKQAKIKASDIPKSVGEGIKQGVYANPTSGKELKSLIKLDDLVNSDQLAKMQEQGMKIPQYLAQGISDGSVSFKTAATQLGNAINWEDLIQQVKDKGKEVPDSIAQGISSGQYAVPTSIKAVENLITFEGMKAKALQGGIEVPDYLANGITSGSMKPEEAVKALSNLVSFQDMIDKAGIEGSKVPTELATRVAQGQISVQAAVKQLTDGVKKDFDKAEKDTSKSKKNIENNTTLKTANNSGAAKSFNVVGNAAKKTANTVKKSKADTEKNSKITPTDNSKSGKKTFESYSKEAQKASSKTKTSVKTLKSTTAKALSSSDGSAKKAGAKLGNDFAKGIASKSGAAKSAGSKVAKAGSSGASAQKSSFVSVGSNLSAGIASGIRSNSGAVSAAAREAVRAAVAAAKAEGKIHSPSRVMESDVGKWMPLGMAAGIRKYTKDVEDASGEMANASVEATATALGIHSPSRVYEDAIGKNIPKGVAKGVREGQTELNAEMNLAVNEALSAAKSASKKGNYSDIGNNLVSGISEALNTAKSRSSETVQEIIDQQTSKVSSKHDTAEKNLQDKISKTKNKKKKAKLKKQLKKLKKQNAAEEKQLKIAGEKTAAAYNDAFEKEADRLNKIAQEKLQGLSDEYQEAYNNIKSKMDSLTDKQQSWGNIYNLDQNIMDIEKYQKNLKSLENKIPESMMEKILGMDIDAGNAYMAWFQHMSEAEQQAYINKWNQQQIMSKTFSENFFGDDLAKLQANYESEMKTVTDDLQKEMKQAGVNIAKGLTAGMESETRNLSKSMKKICQNIIKTAKKTLKIHSPSREFAKIGSRDIQGAIKGHEKEAPNLYKQMGTISQNMAQKFAKAKLNVQDIQSRMQDAINLQMQTITTRMQPVVQTDSANGSESIVYTGPERIEVPLIIDGREVTRVIAPYMDTELSTRATRKSRGGV